MARVASRVFSALGHVSSAAAREAGGFEVSGSGRGLMALVAGRARASPSSASTSSSGRALLGTNACSSASNAMLGSSPSRGYSSWEGHWTSPRRSQLHSDLAAVRSMLPQSRAHLSPQFTAHGFQLVPDGLLSPLPHHLAAVAEAAEAAEAAVASSSSRRSSSSSGGSDGGGGVHAEARAGASAAASVGSPMASPLYADSVKRKRKLKMKRHKYKKRMKELTKAARKA